MKENLKEIAKFSKKDAEVQISRGVPSEDGSRKNFSVHFCTIAKNFLVSASVGIPSPVVLLNVGSKILGVSKI